SERSRSLFRSLARTLVFVHRKIGDDGEPEPEPRLPAEWRRVYENDGVVLYAWQAAS
ncbi:MAG: hypothetical protein HOP12_09855, partial [Candidatus Eisenbacteria bacterium]|nr:hypothetical protein [Candidatus Eisenbacteria bacterium]